MCRPDFLGLKNNCADPNKGVQTRKIEFEKIIVHAQLLGYKEYFCIDFAAAGYIEVANRDCGDCIDCQFEEFETLEEAAASCDSIANCSGIAVQTRTVFGEESTEYITCKTLVHSEDYRGLYKGNTLGTAMHLLSTGLLLLP